MKRKEKRGLVRNGIRLIKPGESGIIRFWGGGGW